MQNRLTIPIIRNNMKLIIINGAPAAGKTTLSLRLRDAMPNSVFISLDDIRRNISHYDKDSAGSLALAYDMMLEMVKICFAKGKDVITNRIILEEDRLNDLYLAARHANAEVVEFLLWASKEKIMERADKRGYGFAKLASHERSAYLWDQLNVFKDKRRNAIVLDIEPDSVHVFEAAKFHLKLQ